MTASADAALSLTPAALLSLGIPHALEPHPHWECPTAEEIAEVCPTAEEAVAFLRPRHEHILRQINDPLRYGYEPASWARCRRALREMREKVPHGVIHLHAEGGNRASKTKFFAKLVMEVLTGRPARHAWCLHATQAASIESQQPHLLEYIPPEWRPGDTGRRKKGGTTAITYSLKSGFAGDKFVLDNRSQCGFKFYASDITTLEGAELDIAWGDELMPLEWIEPVEFRLVTRNGIFASSFTPVEGYTATVAYYLDGAMAIESVEAELLPVRGPGGRIEGYEKVPLMLACKEPRKRVVYFHTKENFYSGYENMVGTLAGATRDAIKLRAYGLTKKRAGVVFTNWSDEENVLLEEAAATVLAKAGDYTWYHVYDPAGARNPFQIWAAVNPTGQILIMREWPQPGDYIEGVGAESGVWAETGGSDDGQRGPAQTSYGFGNDDISREVTRVEKEIGTAGGMERIPVQERHMDSRAGMSPNQTSAGSITLIEIFESLPDSADGEKLALDFEKASGRQTNGDGDNWQAIIQAALVPRKDGTGPQLMVAQNCANVIFALKTWTGRDGQKGACKDPVDTVKYLLLAEPVWVERRAGKARKKWRGY